MLLTTLRNPKSAAVNLRFSAISAAFISILRRRKHHSSAEGQPLAKPELQSLVLSQYANGKFNSLLQNVVASPSLLLTACENLKKDSPDSRPRSPLTHESVSTNFFSIKELSSQLAENSLDVKSCCVRVYPQCHTGSSLLLMVAAKTWVAILRYDI